MVFRFIYFLNDNVTFAMSCDVKRGSVPLLSRQPTRALALEPVRWTVGLLLCLEQVPNSLVVG